MDYSVTTSVFEGPFDLLLHLVAQQRVDLWQVSLAQITDDYLSEIRRMRELDLEIATEFLVVAATLLELKAARLLPRSDDESDPAEGLLQEQDLLFARLLQYQAYREMTTGLAQRFAAQAAFFSRTAGPDESFLDVTPPLLEGVAPERLALLAALALAPTPVPVVQTVHMAPPKLSVAEAAEALALRLRSGSILTFAELLEPDALPIDIVVCFLALLELHKQTLVEVWQEAPLAPIEVRWSGSPDGSVPVLVEEPA